jgi:hypothetical protein
VQTATAAESCYVTHVTGSTGTIPKTRGGYWDGGFGGELCAEPTFTFQNVCVNIKGNYAGGPRVSTGLKSSVDCVEANARRLD